MTETRSSLRKTSGAPEIKNLETLEERPRTKGHLSTQRSISRSIEQYQAAKAGGLINDSTPLSPEEERFVQGMNDGLTLAECYREAWPIESKDLAQEQCHRRGFTISRRAHVIKRFLSIAPESVSEKKHTAMRLRKMRRAVLEEIAQNPKESTSQRLRAVDMLGRLPDVDFTETDEAKGLTSQSSPEDIKKAVESFISKHLKGS